MSILGGRGTEQHPGTSAAGAACLLPARIGHDAGDLQGQVRSRRGKRAAGEPILLSTLHPSRRLLPPTPEPAWCARFWCSGAHMHAAGQRSARGRRRCRTPRCAS
ncbi:hypothetical protein FA95DRAFT_1120340 [Auriscalpium vulgare]|uniref:Uncharacterized protein n=1 Tax=Auriscalpium vulgare TaxID=40419 RepID=A0ACB8RVI5_9AGAM|nr:hypothetical protein FA95DRAFT_1120340 [Auriscalpium vulgare]